jgi:hypothetical protein
MESRPFPLRFSRLFYVYRQHIGICDAYYGRIFACWMGDFLVACFFAIFDHRYAFTNSDYTRASGTKAAHCAVRGIYVCAVRLKNSIRYWEQLTSNGGRTRCGAVWPMNDGSDGKHCIAVSSVIAGTWRIDDIRGKCHVHGSRRPACGLRHLSF